ncbi:hypothetical protein GCM10025857_07120 [Alicyclobacillus contaminans]|nr:recombinase RecT [Alicyclobacillus contaminans]GMA49355.1 hypothetical protein GCM10025857_07120 [Alicyclobacillus contaminans]
MTKADTTAVRGKLQAKSQKPQVSKQQTAPESSFLGVMRAYLNAPEIQSRFNSILKARAPQYVSSILNLVGSDKSLQQCEPMSIISSCMIAATLDLPINRNLGYAWIVPYRDKKNNRVMATFQMGYKGYVQLALRTGKYAKINALPICEGELVRWNPLTEELVYDPSKRKSNRVIGYAGFFRLVNGFEKVVYWTAEQIEAHRQRFSKTGNVWETDYDAMALKTVVRNMLSRWGILSVEMQEAVVRDVEEVTGDDAAPVIDLPPLDETPDVSGDQQTSPEAPVDETPEAPETDEAAPEVGAEGEPEETSEAFRFGLEDDPFAD